MVPNWKISVSKIKTANHCPRQFVIAEKYKKKVYSFRGYGISIGNTVHWIMEKFAQKARTSSRFVDLIAKEGAVQSFNKGVYKIYQDKIQALAVEEGNIEKLNLVWALVKETTSEMANTFEEFFKEDPSYSKSSKEQIIEALRKFFLASEWSFKIPLKMRNNKEVIIAGRLDWLTIDPVTNEAIVWDFKTVPPVNFEMDIQQASLYSLAIKEKLGVNTKAAIFYITISGVEKRIIADKTLKQVQQTLIANLEKIYQWHRGEETPPPTTDIDYCNWCRVADFCREKYGKNPYVPTMGEKWKEFQIIHEKTKKRRETVKKIGRKLIARPITKKTPLKHPTDNFLLGKVSSSEEAYEIHPMVFNKHAAILGASGSGKTVLGKRIIEEALFKGYSALLIDPQGDLCSMILPEKANSPYATLIKDLNWRIYTPGSEKGTKLSINPLETPSKELLTDSDYRNALLDNTSSLILMIIGVDLKRIPPEKALLESIILESWRQGEQLSFALLAKKVENSEEITTITTGEQVATESLVSKQKKKQLARNLFKVAVGTEGAFFIGGESLHLEKLVDNPSLFIVNLASVGTDPTRRQLVVSWILRLVYDWILTHPQQIQDQIRFFLYIDEVAQFLPPYPRNPPSKKMLMLLFQQARKYGVSCLIATQSPASIDYKALDNVSTIFIGKIPTVQSRRKLQSFLEPYGEQLAKQFLSQSQRFQAGEFVVAGVGDPTIFKTDRLRSKHLTLSLDDIARQG